MTYEQQPEPNSPERLEETKREIWIGSLLDYNNGILFGSWIDPARDADAVHADINAMLAASPTAARSGQAAEEWGIFDYEGFEPLRLGEHETIEYVAALARGITEYGAGYAAWASIADHDQLNDYEEHFIAHVSGVEEYVSEMVADLGYDRLLDEVVPPSIRQYVSIDTASLARDMQLGGDITPVSDGEGGYWLFYNH